MPGHEPLKDNPPKPRFSDTRTLTPSEVRSLRQEMEDSAARMADLLSGKVENKYKDGIKKT